MSPQINGDNTVTFRLFAPEAGSVQVTGDCIAERPVSMPDGSTVNVRTADMARNADGVWEYTVPEPLASELYSYNLIVDGVKVGAMIGGQVLPTEPDENKFRDIAKELGIDENAYVQAVRKVPVRSEKAIRAAAEFLGIVVNQMVNLEYLKSRDTKRLKTFDDGLQSATDSVEAIRNNTRKLDDISTKQNILSLNASIEAARAGMTGAGFAVVAKQMGDLSQQSKTIYQEIERLSEEIYATVSKMNKN